MTSGAGRLSAQVGGVFAFRLLSLIASLFASVLAARTLGPTLRGELAVMIALPALVTSLLLLGLDMANMSFAGRSPAAQTRIARYSLIYAAVVGTVTAVVGIVLSHALPPLRLGLDPTAFAWALALTPILLASALLGAAEAGRGRPVPVAGATALATIGYVATIVVITSVGAAQPLALFLGFGFSQLALAGFLFGVSRPFVRLSGHAVSLREYVTFGLRADVAAIAMLLLLRIDVPLIQILAGPGEVGIYATALPMAEALLMLPTAATLVVAPRSAQGRMSGSDALRVAQVTLVLALAGGFVIALIAPVGVPMLFGREFASAIPVLWTLLPGLVLLASSRILQVYLIASGRFRLATLSAVAALGLCVTLELLLIPRLGAMGAAIATTISYAVFAAIIWVNVVQRIGKDLRPHGRTCGSVLPMVSQTGAWILSRVSRAGRRGR